MYQLNWWRLALPLCMHFVNFHNQPVTSVHAENKCKRRSGPYLARVELHIGNEITVITAVSEGN